MLVGRLDERMLSDDRDNQTSYAMFTLDKDYPGLGRVRVFDMLKRVADTIPDDRRAPLPFLDAPTPPLVADMLFFPRYLDQHRVAGGGLHRHCQF